MREVLAFSSDYMEGRTRKFLDDLQKQILLKHRDTGWTANGISNGYDEA